MPIFELQTPDGRTFEVDAPDMQSAAGALGGQEQTVNSGAKSGPDSFSNAAIAQDMWQQGKQEFKNAATGLMGLPRAAADLAGDAAAGWTGIMGRPEAAEGVRKGVSDTTAFMLNPVGELTGTSRTEDLNKIAEGYMGPDQNAQTWQGRLTGDVTSMAAGAIGPGGLVRKGAQVALPGIAAFAAGEAAEGTAARPWAKAGAAFAGGVGAGVGAKRQAVNAALKQASFKTQEQAAKATKAAYDELRQAGVSYEADDFGRMAGRLGDKLLREDIMQTDAPKTWARINKILDGAQAGREPAWGEINSMRKSLGRLMRSSDSEERTAAAMVFGELAKFEKTAGMRSAAGMSQADMVSKAARAREYALRNIKAKEFGKREARAETYTSGIESGLKNQTANMLRSKYGEALFTNPDEREMLKTVTAGGAPRKALAAFGKLGFDFSRLGNANSVIPALGLAGAGGYGAGTGDWENAGKMAAVMGAGSLAKMGARKLTERDARRAMAIILAGPKAQRDMVLAAKGAKREQMLRAVLASQGAYQARE